MTWDAWATIIAAIGIMSSMLLTLRGHRKQDAIARAQLDESRHVAERTEAAARLSEDYSQRVVDALEAIASRGGELKSAARGVRWSLEHHKGDTFRLTNMGDDVATEVTVTGHESLAGPDHVKGGPELGPGEALTFMAVVMLATADTTISVEWSESIDGERRTWRYPLPPG